MAGNEPDLRATMIAVPRGCHEAMKACVAYIKEHERDDFVREVIQGSESFREAMKKARDHIFFSALRAEGGAYEADTEFMDMWRENEKYR